jgi:hypothetical protein
VIKNVKVKIPSTKYVGEFYDLGPKGLKYRVWASKSRQVIKVVSTVHSESMLLVGGPELGLTAGFEA